MSKQRVIIAGGGIIGLCSAYYLARRGLDVQDVTVVDRRPIAESASAGNAGIIALGHPPLPRPHLAWKALRWMCDRRSPLYIKPRLDPDLIAWFWNFRRACNAELVARAMPILASLGRASLSCYESIIESEGISCDWRRDGWLDVYRTEAGRRQAEQEAAPASREGFAVRQLDGEELREKEPAYGPDVCGAIHYADSAALDPQRFVIALAAHLARSGVNIRQDGGVARLHAESGICRGVYLQNGEQLEADCTVLAAGAWSSPLARTAGVRLPLQAAKGYHVDLGGEKGAVRTPCVLTEAFVAVNPLAVNSRGGRLRLAGTLEFSGLDLRLDDKRLAMLRRGAERYLPDLKSAAEVSSWCGLRPCTADGLPVVGWAPGVKGLFIATGHAKMGMTHGPATGRLVSEFILDSAPGIDCSLLSPDRFQGRTFLQRHAPP